MELFSTIISLIGGIGIGSFVGAWLHLSWDKKRFLYETKLKLYSNFIENYQSAAANPSDQQLQQKAVASLKILELITDDEIVDESQRFYSGGGSEVRDNLIKSMRNDLSKSIK